MLCCIHMCPITFSLHCSGTQTCTHKVTRIRIHVTLFMRSLCVLQLLIRSTNTILMWYFDTYNVALAFSSKLQWNYFCCYFFLSWWEVVCIDTWKSIVVLPFPVFVTGSIVGDGYAHLFENTFWWWFIDTWWPWWTLTQQSITMLTWLTNASTCYLIYSIIRLTNDWNPGVRYIYWKAASKSYL